MPQRPGETVFEWIDRIEADPAVLKASGKMTRQELVDALSNPVEGPIFGDGEADDDEAHSG